MKFYSGTLKIEPYSSFLPQVLCFQFDGDYTHGINEKLNIELKRELGALSIHPQYTLVWDCTSMTGYGLLRHTQWMNILYQYRSRISRIVVISDNQLIRMASRFLFQSLKIKHQVIKYFIDIDLATEINTQKEATAVA